MNSQTSRPNYEKAPGKVGPGNAASPRRCTSAHPPHCNGCNMWMQLQTTVPPSIFSRPDIIWFSPNQTFERFSHWKGFVRHWSRYLGLKLVNSGAGAYIIPGRYKWTWKSMAKIFGTSKGPCWKTVKWFQCKLIFSILFSLLIERPS